MLVKDIMNSNVEVINCEKSVFDAAQMMARGDYGSLPVERDDKMIGMITDRDITIRVVAERKDPSKTKVYDCMTEKITYCFDDEDVEGIADKMKSAQIHRIPVVNRDKRLVGIVSSKELVSNAQNPKVTQETLNQIYQ
ncbi:CBS domain-containing protein [Peredibacter starrii]|uniref:CBS domain-containing protein n=1 Tax=Peredibacter starrii TaxID=28202 RepID=A0AAX4HTN7_9BACT|nr:CBS domain-containing protein [Peredibacter starrii]WPU66756.1 CBS domain-containing protein [Peredibacter starrii]